jgi:hypothetical protein
VGRRIDKPPTAVSGPTDSQVDRWLGQFLMASEPGSEAALISAAIRAADGLEAKWAVIDRMGLRDAAERFLAVRVARMSEKP